MLYLGISQLAIGESQNSISTLSTVEKNSKKRVIVEYAQWFKALAYLKTENISEAKSILLEFSSKPNSDFYKEASTLLDAL